MFLSVKTDCWAILKIDIYAILSLPNCVKLHRSFYTKAKI